MCVIDSLAYVCQLAFGGRDLKHTQTKCTNVVSIKRYERAVTRAQTRSAKHRHRRRCVVSNKEKVRFFLVQTAPRSQGPQAIDEEIGSFRFHRASGQQSRITKATRTLIAYIFMYVYVHIVFIMSIYDAKIASRVLIAVAAPVCK